MQRALAIETSGRTGSVAVIQDGTIVVERTFPHGLRHAAGILPMMDQMCREQGWRPQDLQTLHLSAGPGSFTGLRIGITLAKTLALATGVKLIAVPTLRVLAENAPPDATEVVMVLDAKRGQIFSARYRRDGSDWIEQAPARLTTLKAALAEAPRPVWLLGEGIEYHRTEIPQDSSVFVTGPEAWQARASAVARVGIAMEARGIVADPQTLTPLYIRLPEAEEKRLAQHAPPQS